MQCDIKVTFDSQLNEINYLQDINNNLINEMKISENELILQLTTLDCDFKDTSINGNVIIPAKEYTFEILSRELNSLTNECEIKSENNRDLTIIKNNLLEELDKYKYE